MQFVCDGGAGRTWFRIETEAEAQAESELMRHAVYRYFLREQDRAALSYNPQGRAFIEQDIGRKAHIARSMPMFITLRADDGAGLATAMLPPEGRPDSGFRVIIVGPENADPYEHNADAIRALATRFRIALPREKCFPYG
jgi:hypothetical protein